MRSKMIIIALLSLMSLAMSAQEYKSGPELDPVIQSQKIMSTGVTFNGVVYEPFDNTPPSEYNKRNAKPGIRREGDDDPWGHNQDAGEKDEASPIGDGILPLLAAALAFGGVIYLRRRKRMNTER